MTPDVPALLAEWDALSEAASDGPWVVTSWSPKGVMPERWAEDSLPTDERGPFAHIGTTADADAAFIAAARTALPAATAALRAVLDLHITLHTVVSGNPPLPCRACGEPMPCPTIRAITAALTKEA